jgi:hypothetical protein
VAVTLPTASPAVTSPLPALVSPATAPQSNGSASTANGSPATAAAQVFAAPSSSGSADDLPLGLQDELESILTDLLPGKRNNVRS